MENRYWCKCAESNHAPTSNPWASARRGRLRPHPRSPPVLPDEQKGFWLSPHRSGRSSARGRQRRVVPGGSRLCKVTFWTWLTASLRITSSLICGAVRWVWNKSHLQTLNQTVRLGFKAMPERRGQHLEVSVRHSSF